TYQTGFYRELHRLLHRDLDLRLALANGAAGDPAVRAELATGEARLDGPGRDEAGHPRPRPTGIGEGYGPPAAPPPPPARDAKGARGCPAPLRPRASFLTKAAREVETMSPSPPLGLLYLSAYLKRAGFDVEVWDSTFATPAELAARLAAGRGVVGIYTNLIT